MANVSDTLKCSMHLLSYAESMNFKNGYKLAELVATIFCTGRYPTAYSNVFDKDIELLAQSLVLFIENNKYRLPKAICINKLHNVPPNRACKVNKVPVSEFKYANDLINDLDLHVDKLISKMPQNVGNDWRSEIGLLYSDVEVYISDRAIEEMIIFGMESYVVHRSKGKSYTEIYGLCFGNSRITPKNTKYEGNWHTEHIHIERCAVQLKGKATASSFEENPKSTEIQSDIREIFFPHESIIGNFHTHPYHKVEYVKNPNIGVQESSQDKGHTIWWHDYLFKNYNDVGKISLIMAIGKNMNTKSYISKKRRNFNTIDFSFKNFHIAIAAYRILPDSSTSDKGIKLYCPKILGWEAI